MAAFTKLHEGIDTKCNCLEQPKVTENLNDTFARRVKNIPPALVDFASYHEENRRIQKGKENDCRCICEFRGVSINKVDATNEDTLIKDWKEEIKNKPKSSSIYCKFRIKTDECLVWDTSHQKNKFHFTLLKADEFKIEDLEIVEVYSLASTNV